MRSRIDSISLSGLSDVLSGLCVSSFFTANFAENVRRERRVRLYLLLLTAAILVAPLFAQDAKIAPAQRAQLEAKISKFKAGNKVPGLSVAVVENSEVVWAEGFGMADMENLVLATSKTLYRLGSISKPLTATAAMQLWERGKLDLDAPVQKYCPRFPKKEQPITTRELLGHLAGIRHYNSESQNDPELGNVKHFDDPIAAGLQFFANDPLVAPPGTHFHYSTQGYTVVGCAIEGASAQEYVDFVKANVLQPAGMTQTQPDDRFTIIPYRTRFYQKDKNGTVINADFLDSSYKIPGGGWLSSAEDMARFEVAILHDRLMRRSTRDLMWTSLKPSDGSEDTYGLGWGRITEAGMNAVGHSGSQQGTSTSFLIAPESGAGVVVLVNLEEVAANQLAKQLLHVVLSTTERQQ